jgi:glycosyltransferase involved in cell wall biosynthesis
LLHQAVESIINQSFADFEVIVGNDYPTDFLSAHSLKIHDSRIRFINHPENLGEIKNMSVLLENAGGRYFTWLADDDLYAPDFLKRVHEALLKFNLPRCCYTAHVMGSDYITEGNTEADVIALSGRQFLRNYMSRSIKVFGCYGVFDIESLRNLGGMEQLGCGFSPYSDNLLVIKSCLLNQIAYVDSPLVFFRTHDESISLRSTDIETYQSAQKDFCNRCRSIFLATGVLDDFEHNLLALLRWCAEDFASLARRSPQLNWTHIREYLAFLLSYSGYLKGSLRYRYLQYIAHVAARLVIYTTYHHIRRMRS